MLDERLLAKAVGVFAGTLLSLIMVAPESTRNAFFRVVVGCVSGVIFTPITQQLIPVFRGDTFEILVAASAATGFTCWFVLEFIARIMSSRNTMARLLEEVLRLRGITADLTMEDKDGQVTEIKVEQKDDNN